MNFGKSRGGEGASGKGGAGSLSSEVPWRGVSSVLCIDSDELIQVSTRFCLDEGKTNVGSSSEKIQDPQQGSFPDNLVVDTNHDKPALGLLQSHPWQQKHQHSQTKLRQPLIFSFSCPNPTRKFGKFSCRCNPKRKF